MENNTLQQRIEERAKQRLLKDLFEASKKLDSVGYLIGHDFASLLRVTEYFEYSNRREFLLKNELTKEIFEKLLPKYISIVTDEILQKVDEIDWLLQNKNQEQDYN